MLSEYNEKGLAYDIAEGLTLEAINEIWELYYDSISNDNTIDFTDIFFKAGWVELYATREWYEKITELIDDIIEDIETRFEDFIDDNSIDKLYNYREKITDRFNKRFDFNLYDNTSDSEIYFDHLEEPNFFINHWQRVASNNKERGLTQFFGFENWAQSWYDYFRDYNYTEITIDQRVQTMRWLWSIDSPETKEGLLILKKLLAKNNA